MRTNRFDHPGRCMRETPIRKGGAIRCLLDCAALAFAAFKNQCLRGCFLLSRHAADKAGSAGHVVRYSFENSTVVSG